MYNINFILSSYADKRKILVWTSRMMAFIYSQFIFCLYYFSCIVQAWRLLGGRKLDGEVCFGATLVGNLENIATSWQFSSILSNGTETPRFDEGVWLQWLDKPSRLILKPHQNIHWILLALCGSWVMTLWVSLGSDLDGLRHLIYNLVSGSPGGWRIRDDLRLNSISVTNINFTEVAKHVLIRHPEDTVVRIDKVNLCLHCGGPVGVFVTPFTFVSLRTPWVSHFGEHVSSNILKIKEWISVTWCKSIGGYASNIIAATGSGRIVFGSPRLVNSRELWWRLTLMVKEVGWLTCKSSQSFNSIAPCNSVVILIKLGICFLEKWHPPGTKRGSSSSPWSEGATPFSCW
mgnify:FL=1